MTPLQVAWAQPGTSMAQSVCTSLESATGQKLAPSLAAQGLGAYVHLAELGSSATVDEGKCVLSPNLHRCDPWFPALLPHFTFHPKSSLRTLDPRCTSHVAASASAKDNILSSARRIGDAGINVLAAALPRHPSKILLCDAAMAPLYLHIINCGG